MAALYCGLGTAAIPTAVTFTCTNLSRVNEVTNPSPLTSSRCPT